MKKKGELNEKLKMRQENRNKILQSPIGAEESKYGSIPNSKPPIDKKTKRR